MNRRYCARAWRQSYSSWFRWSDVSPLWARAVEGHYNPGLYNPDITTQTLQPEDITTPDVTSPDITTPDFTTQGHYNPGRYIPRHYNPGHYNPRTLQPRTLHPRTTLLWSCTSGCREFLNKNAKINYLYHRVSKVKVLDPQTIWGINLLT